MKENIFFSGSVKSGLDLNYFFPSNQKKDLITGQEFNCDSDITVNAVVGVTGVISDQDYSKILETKECFGVPFDIE